MATPNLFTPYINKNSTVRAHIELSDEDMAKIGRGKPWTAEVTDLMSNTKLRVKGTSCGSPRCYCAAVIEEEL